MQPFTQSYPILKASLEKDAVLHHNRKCLRDLSRSPNDSHYFRPFTQEEIVRQSFIKYLLDELHYSKDLLHTELSIGRTNCKKSDSMRRRIDLCIFKNGKPNILVEFKSEEISLIQCAYEQGKRYILDIGCPYLMLCNGRQVKLYSNQDDSIVPIVDTPKDLYEFERDLTHTASKHYSFNDDYFQTDQTETWAISYLKALQNAIIYSSICGAKTAQYDVVEDLGYDFGTFRNASGSKGVMGVYHYYELQFHDGNRDILGISITKYDQPIENRNTANLLVVGIGNKSCLEYQASSKFIRTDPGGFVVYRHNGSTGIAGLSGASSLSMLQKCLPDMSDDKYGIIFGRHSGIAADSILGIVIANIIRLAIEREHLKILHKQSRLR